MKPTKIIATLTFAALLAGCQIQPQQTLTQKLEGKSPKESKEVLRLACLNEAEAINPVRRVKRPHSIVRLPDSKELREMKNVCRDMTDMYLVQDSKEADQQRIDLAKRCENRLNADLKSSKVKNIDNHFEHISIICEKMTGHSINKQ